MSPTLASYGNLLLRPAREYSKRLCGDSFPRRRCLSLPLFSSSVAPKAHLAIRASVSSFAQPTSGLQYFRSNDEPSASLRLWRAAGDSQNQDVRVGRGGRGASCRACEFVFFLFLFLFFCAPLFSNKNCHCSHRFAARGFRSPLAAKISSAPQWSTHKHAILESYHVNSSLIREINHILRKEITQPSRSRHKRQMSYKLHLPKYFKVYDVARPALSRTFPAA